MPIRDEGFLKSKEMENLRLGTRQQYTSEWTVINDGETHTFIHLLEEVPWVVSAVYSESAQGNLARDATSNVTLTKSRDNITCLNGFSDAVMRYFQIRAM